MEPDGRNYCHVIVTFLCCVFSHAYPSYSSGYLNQYGLMDVHPVSRDAILLLITLLPLWPSFDYEKLLFHTNLYHFNIQLLCEHFHIWNMTRLSRLMFQNSMCMWYTCKHMCVSMCVDTRVCTWVFGGLRLTLNVFLCLSSPHMLRAGSLTMSKYAILATLLTACSGDFLSCLVSSEVGFRDLQP